MKTQLLKQLLGVSLIAGFLFTAVTPVFAAEDESLYDPTAALRSFRSMMAPVLFSTVSTVPVVAELTLPPELENGQYIGVYNHSEERFVPFITLSETETRIPVTLAANTVSSAVLGRLVDGDRNTSVDFPLDEQTTGTSLVTVTYTFAEPVRSDTLRMVLDQYVVLPERVSIRAQVGNVMQRVVASIVPTSSQVTFPEMTSSVWEVTLEYKQPLRFAELSFINKNVVSKTTSIRFLADTTAPYAIFYNPEVVVHQRLGEMPNLRGNDRVYTATVGGVFPNPQYEPADTDQDGIIDVQDNCPRHENADQADVDLNGRGDACEDFDRDGVVNQVDNCPNAPNREQSDIDRDGVGDTCDADESRVTEKYPIIVWLALGLAVAVFAGLFVIAMRHKEEEVPPQV